MSTRCATGTPSPTEYLLVPEWITIPLLIIEIHGCQTDFLRNKSDVNCYSISLVYPDKKGLHENTGKV